ncbi:hypothetical protein D3C85_1391340 [compost metagenome]
MGKHGVAFVNGFAKKDTFPKIVHFGQVMLPVYLRYLGKYWSDFIIQLYLLVKTIDQKDNVFPVVNIVFHSAVSLGLSIQVQ